MSAGGMKFLHGSPADYVTYFVGEDGKGVTTEGYYGDGQRWVVTGEGVRRDGKWTAQEYGNWLAGADPESGEMRGSKRAVVNTENGNADGRSGVLAYEYGVNVPKSASIVAALDDELGRVLIEAQERAAGAGVEMLRGRARTRVSVDGVQQLVAVDQLEVAVFSHPGSRDGDPQQHLHVQVGTKVFVEGKWRSLAGLQMQRAVGEWNATVSAALATDPAWVQACAERGLTVGEDGGIVEVPREVERALSNRTVAIEEHLAERIAHYKEHNAGAAPSARTTAKMMREAWEATRHKKGDRPLVSRSEVAARVEAAGGRAVLDALGAPRSARVVALAVPVAVDQAVRIANEREVLRDPELAEVAAKAINATGGTVNDLRGTIESVRLGLRKECVAVDLPGGQTAWMPTGVLNAATQVQDYLTTMSATATVQPAGLKALVTEGLAPAQAVAAEAVAAGLPVVIEGPAGTGKTTALRAALAARQQAGLATFAVAKASSAVAQLGDGWTGRSTADSLLRKAGWESGPDGWIAPAEVQPIARMRGSVLIVDEAAMMDLHTLSAVSRLATEQGARVVLVGDDRQLAAVGAAGGFTVAARGLDVIALEEAQRFHDPSYGPLMAELRDGTGDDVVVADLVARGAVRVHATEDDALIALAEEATATDALVMASDNATASQIARLARAERVAAGQVHEATTRLGRLDEHMGVGDLIQTRANDRLLGVGNRDRWIVRQVGEDGSLTVAPVGENGTVGAREVALPAAYVRDHVHHADAVTVYAAQGATATKAHALVDGTWTREELYVALTRGRAENTVHVVAVDTEDAVAELDRILGNFQRENAEMVAAAVRDRVTLARAEVAPSLAQRIVAGYEATVARVASWGSSMFTPQAPPPAEPPSAPPPGKEGPVL